MTGITLAELLRRPTRNTHSVSLSILRQAAAILDDAHRRGHVHPALSPESILISPVLDDRFVEVEIPDVFGAERPSLHNESSRQSAPEHAKYMSREEVLGMTRNGQSDVFSLGAIGYELLTGRKPFDAPDLSQLCYAICVEQPQPANELSPEVPASAARVLDRAMAKEASARYETCTDFVEALAAALPGTEEVPTVAAPTVPAPTVPAPAVAAPVFATPAAAAPVETLAAEPSPVAATPRSAESAFSATVRAAGEPSRLAAAAAATAAWSSKTLASDLPPPAMSTVASPPLPLPPLPPRNTARRKSEWEEPDPLVPKSPLQRFGLIGLAVILLLGVLALVLNWHPASSVPVQVLDSKSGPVTPPPGPESTSPAATERASTTGSSTPAGSTDTAPSTLPNTPPPSSADRLRSSAPQGHTPAGTATGRQFRAAKSPTFPAARQSQPITPPSASGSAFVEMLTEPPGAHLMVDNRAAATCIAPCSLELPAGRHVLTADLAGYATTSRIFHVPDERSVVVAMLQSVGTVLVTSNPPGATILVDGKDAGRAPLTLHLRSGQHRLDAMYGASAQQKVLDVRADDIQGANFDLH